MRVTRARTGIPSTVTSMTSPTSGIVARCCVSTVSPSASPMRASLIRQILSSAAVARLPSEPRVCGAPAGLCGIVAAMA